MIIIITLKVHPLPLMEKKIITNITLSVYAARLVKIQIALSLYQVINNHTYNSCSHTCNKSYLQYIQKEWWRPGSGQWTRGSRKGATPVWTPEPQQGACPRPGGEAPPCCSSFCCSGWGHSLWKENLLFSSHGTKEKKKKYIDIQYICMYIIDMIIKT